ARSIIGVPKARDANIAICAALIRLESTICSTKPMLAACACDCIVSASYSDNRPCCTIARARPLMVRTAALVAMIVDAQVAPRAVGLYRRGGAIPYRLFQTHKS